MVLKILLVFTCFMLMLPQLVFTQQEDNVMRAVVILTEDCEKQSLFCRMRVEPALHVARETVEERKMLGNYSIQLKFMNGQCHQSHSPVQAFQAYRQNEVDIYLGPVCDYALAPVARVAAIWQLPVISPGGMAHNFVTEKLVEYQTLTRIMGASFALVYTGKESNLTIDFNIFHPKKGSMSDLLLKEVGIDYSRSVGCWKRWPDLEVLTFKLCW
nr:hypothetical protein BaRGS_000060 [Batillaria attramentaria]